MKRNIFISLIVAIILIIFSTLIFAETINVKDYIKGKFPTIFTIYLSSLGELDEYEKEFIDLLQNLPEEEQKSFAKEVYNNGFSKEILEKVKNVISKPVTKIEEREVKTPILNISKWVCNKGVDPMDDKIVVTFTLKNENSEIADNPPIYLVLRKKGKKTNIYIDWNRGLASRLGMGFTVLKERYGKGKAFTRSWDFISSLEYALLGDQQKEYQLTYHRGSDSKLIRKLMTIDKYTVQAKQDSQTIVTAVFDVRGLKNAVKQYNDILHWIEE